MIMTEQTQQIAMFVYHAMGTCVMLVLLVYLGYLIWFILRKSKQIQADKDTIAKIQKERDVAEEKQKTAEELMQRAVKAKEAVEKEKAFAINLQSAAEAARTAAEKKLKAMEEQVHQLGKTLPGVGLSNRCLVDQAKVNALETKIGMVAETCEKLFNWMGEFGPQIAKCSGLLNEEFRNSLDRQKNENAVQLTELQEKVNCAERKTKGVEEELARVNQELENVKSERNNLQNQLTGLSELQAQIQQQTDNLQKKERELQNVKWMQVPQFEWIESFHKIVSLLQQNKPEMATNHFLLALLQTLISTRFPLEEGGDGMTINGTPDEIMMRVDEVFFGRMHESDKELALLEQARCVYFTRFNELFEGRYEIRWPKRGETFDETYCRLDRDNGFTEVRVAISCAIFENGDLKRRARVETVPRT